MVRGCFRTKVSGLTAACIVLLATSPDAARGIGVDWVRQLASNDEDFGFAVSADSLGNVFISGSTRGSLAGPHPGSGSDGIVAKYDSAGDLIWVKQFGSSSTSDESFGASADGQGNVFVSGTSTRTGPGVSKEALLRKYDGAGTLLWARKLGPLGINIETEGLAVAADISGNAYLSGSTEASLGGPNAGLSDAFLSKYDSAGNILWSRQLGTPSADQSYGVSADTLGNVYITGITHGSLARPNMGSWDSFVSKYDADGNHKWTRQFGGSSRDVARGVSADSLGNVFVTGSTRNSLGSPTAGEVDAFLSKFDEAGNLVWIRQFGTNLFDVSYGVSADGYGNAYITGHTNRNFVDGLGWWTGSEDAFVSKYDSAGNVLWSHHFPSITVDAAFAVSADGLGNVYMSGVTLLSSAGSPRPGDVIVVKIIPEPPPLTMLVLGGVLAGAVMRPSRWERSIPR
jgi:hypothetical protein